jgi:hypothetical protein
LLAQLIIGAQVNYSADLASLNADTQAAGFVSIELNVAATVARLAILKNATLSAIGQAERMRNRIVRIECCNGARRCDRQSSSECFAGNVVDLFAPSAPAYDWAETDRDVPATIASIANTC